MHWEISLAVTAVVEIDDSHFAPGGYTPDQWIERERVAFGDFPTFRLTEVLRNADELSVLLRDMAPHEPRVLRS